MRREASSTSIGVNPCNHQTQGNLMTDEVQNSSAQTEFAQPETSQQDNALVQPVAQQQEGKHFAKLRRQNDELQNKVKMQEEMMNRLLAQQPQNQAPQPMQEQIEIGDEEYVQGSKFKRVVEKAVEDGRRAGREEAQKVIQDQHKSQFHQRLKSKYADFDDVVNPETLAILEDEDPDLASAIVASQDPYQIGVQSYKYIKALGLVSKAPSARRTREVEKAIEDNSKKVQSPQAFDKRPVAQAFQYTEQNKKELQAEMYKYAQQAGMGY